MRQAGWTPGGQTVALVAAAAQAWRRGLVDVSGSNRRLFYAPLRVGTLLLADADPAAMAKLLAGDAVRLSTLFPDDGTEAALARQGNARRAADLLAAKARLGEEETGDSPVRLGLGLATWASDTGVVSHPGGSSQERAPRSPLVLCPVHFTMTPGTRAVASIALTGEPELNTTLKFVLETQFGVDLDTRGWLAEAVEGDAAINPGRLLQAAARLAGRIDGWQVEAAAVVDTFGSDRELMLRDLEDEQLLAAHPLLAAMAGDAGAQAVQRGEPLPEDGSDKAAPDNEPVALEHLVLDADASQQAVIAHALAGRSLTVAGPPGCGKSQVITNLIAEAAAAGRTVLFVAQKRAAVDAVMDRLDAVGLSGAVLEVFDTRTRRGNVVAQLRASLDRLGTVVDCDAAALHRDLQASRDRLVAHSQALHAPRELLGGATVYDLLGRVAAIALAPQTSQRLPFGVVRDWQGDRVDHLAECAAELATLDGLDPARDARPGWNVIAVTTAAISSRGYDAAATVSSAGPAAQRAVTGALAAVGLPPPCTPAQARAALGLLESAAAAADRFVPGALTGDGLDDLSLDRTIAAVGDRGERQALPTRLGYFARRALRSRLAALLLPDARPAADPTVHRWLIELRELRLRWREALPGGPDAAGAVPGPTPAPELAAARAALEPLTESLAVLGPLTQRLPLTDASFEQLRGTADALLADQARATLPRVYNLRLELAEAGAGPILESLGTRIAHGETVDAAFAADRLRYVAFMSTLDHLQGADPSLAREPGRLTADEAQFSAADRTHIRVNRDVVARLVAEHTRSRLNAFPEQRLAVQDQVRRKRSFKSLRQLVEQAPEALLALKPCWAMSPLLVSRYLPALPGLFDLVVFDEASQVLVPDAVPSLLRGRQAVVAGDEKQLPPTTVFTKMLDSAAGVWGAEAWGEGTDGADAGAGEDVDLQPPAAPPSTPSTPVVSVAAGYQSVLGALGSLLPSRTLLWHYRSRDERLIAVSNQEVYGGSLITFPGPAGSEVLRHVVVAPSPGLGSHNKSPEAEVETVCALVLGHAREQLGAPAADRLSLGVIAMGRDHADRVEKAVFAALEDAPDRHLLAELFDENAPEPYFFKNIERVQGDERDVIIVTVGYGTSRDGRLRYMWGPLLGEYGVNRLNVAITRARARLTLVTSFTADQLPENGSAAPGYQLMRAFVTFVASGGTHLPSTAPAVPMNPFEQEICARLTAAGLHLDPQYGVSGYRLDFAVRHPDFDGSTGRVRHLLAIECDGRTWHSGWTARERDRLRQQQLETLGWRFHRIWSTDWFRDPDAEVDRVLAAFHDAVARSRAGLRPAAPLPAPDPRWLGGSGPAAAPAAGARPAPAWVTPGAPIGTYSQARLVALVGWLRSDGVLRLADDEIGQLVAALGFQRRGPVIVARLTAAQQACDAAARPRTA